MNADEIKTALRDSLTDQRLSRKEQKHLRKLIDGQREEDKFRHVAFQVAQEALRPDAEDTAVVLKWLEDVSRAVTFREVGRSEIREAHFSPGEDCRNRLTRALSQARDTIDICVFTITDDRLTDAIIAAHERGVRVRIASDNDKAEDRGSDVFRLLDMGLDVRIDKSPHHMHHKFAIFDRRLLINGSYNWTRSAFRSNRENILATTNPLLLRRFLAEFDAMWKTFR